MDRCASGKTQGFKSLNCLIITNLTEIERQLLLKKINRDKFFGFLVVESSADSWKNPLIQVTASITVFYCVDSLIVDA